MWYTQSHSIRMFVSPTLLIRLHPVFWFFLAHILLYVAIKAFWQHSYDQASFLLLSAQCSFKSSWRLKKPLSGKIMRTDTWQFGSLVATYRRTDKFLNCKMMREQTQFSNPVKICLLLMSSLQDISFKYLFFSNSQFIRANRKFAFWALIPMCIYLSGHCVSFLVT